MHFDSKLTKEEFLAYTTPKEREEMAMRIKESRQKKMGRCLNYKIKKFSSII